MKKIFTVPRFEILEWGTYDGNIYKEQCVGEFGEATIRHFDDSRFNKNEYEVFCRHKDKSLSVEVYRFANRESTRDFALNFVDIYNYIPTYKKEQLKLLLGEDVYERLIRLRKGGSDDSNRHTNDKRVT